MSADRIEVEAIEPDSLEDYFNRASDSCEQCFGLGTVEIGSDRYACHCVAPRTDREARIERVTGQLRARQRLGHTGRARELAVELVRLKLPPGAPRGARYAYCKSCNARERLIIGGRCHVCGQDPEAVPA